MNRNTAIVASMLLLSAGSAAHAGLIFDFSDGPGLLALDISDPTKAAGIRSGAAAAASRWSARWADPVTLKITLDYDASPSFPLGASFASFDPAGTPYPGVKAAMMGDVSSPFDVSATSSLQPGPKLDFFVNDETDGPTFPSVFDADGSTNNTVMDITSSNLKALGILPGGSGGAGSDGTIKFGSAPFDFDPSDGITAGTYDFVGVALHELAHNMGFISGVDTVAALFAGAPFVPPGDPDMAIMATTLDLFRYSDASFGMAPGGFIPDLSLPTPGPPPIRYFSIDGGFSPVELFATGDGLAGDGDGAGHWADGPSPLWLMNPDLAPGYALTDSFDAMMGIPTPDMIALDVIGWTYIPAPGTMALAGLASLAVIRRRR